MCLHKLHSFSRGYSFMSRSFFVTRVTANLEISVSKFGFTSGHGKMVLGTICLLKTKRKMTDCNLVYWNNITGPYEQTHCWKGKSRGWFYNTESTAHISFSLSTAAQRFAKHFHFKHKTSRTYELTHLHFNELPRNCDSWGDYYERTQASFQTWFLMRSNDTCVGHIKHSSEFV